LLSEKPLAFLKHNSDDIKGLVSLSVVCQQTQEQPYIRNCNRFHQGAIAQLCHHSWVGITDHFTTGADNVFPAIECGIEDSIKIISATF